jgi:hypothetical protein
MKITYLLAALLLMPSFATHAMAHVGTGKASNRAHGDTRLAFGSRLQGYRIVAREIATPAWSFACSPQQCEEPMWVYGSPDYLAQFRNSF